MAISSQAAQPEIKENSFSIFLSYQWKIQSKVRLLYQELASREQLNVFMDIFKIKAGMNLYSSLASNIQQADVVLACVTRDYVKSKNCEREIVYADALNKPIIPLYMEKIPMPELGSIGFLLVRERYCNLYKNEKAFDDLSESDELKDILDGIQSSIKKQGYEIEIEKRKQINMQLNDDSINSAVIQFRNDNPIETFLGDSKNVSQQSSVPVKQKKNDQNTEPTSKSQDKKASTSQNKTQKSFDFFQVHPVIKELKFLTQPKMWLDAEGDRFSFEKTVKIRGNEPYVPPVGWLRYGIRVKSVYPDVNKWLTKDGNPMEWAVCYHGFKSNPLRSNLYFKLFDKNGKLNPYFEASKNLKFANVVDVNPKSLRFNTECGLGVFCSKSPENAEEKTAIFTLNNVRYKMLLQCRVNPERIRIPKIDTSLYIINNSHNIRPYGILIKEI